MNLKLNLSDEATQAVLAVRNDYNPEGNVGTFAELLIILGKATIDEDLAAIARAQDRISELDQGRQAIPTPDEPQQSPDEPHELDPEPEAPDEIMTEGPRGPGTFATPASEG